MDNFVRVLTVASFFACGTQAFADDGVNSVCAIEFDGIRIVDGPCYVEFDGGFTMIFSPVTDVKGAFKYEQFIRLENNEDTAFVNYNGGGGSTHAQAELGEFEYVGENAEGLACFKGSRGEVCFKQQ